MPSGYEKSADYGGPDSGAWLRYLFAHFLAPWVTAVRVGSWPVYAGTEYLSDLHDGLVEQCRALQPGHVLTFRPDAVVAAYGNQERALVFLPGELGDSAGERYRLAFTRTGALVVSLVEPSGR